MSTEYKIIAALNYILGIIEILLLSVITASLIRNSAPILLIVLTVLLILLVGFAAFASLYYLVRDSRENT